MESKSGKHSATRGKSKEREFDFRGRFAGRRKQRASTVSGLKERRMQKGREVTLRSNAEASHSSDTVSCWLCVERYIGETQSDAERVSESLKCRKFSGGLEKNYLRCISRSFSVISASLSL